MSRCFPFPPPGYEKILSIDNVNLLTKDKHKEKKEKKHKKDKKDKEKSKEKHRDKEKKEKKEKHRDKDRDKNAEKKKSSDDKRIEGQVGNGLQQETSLVQELARRTSDNNNAVQGSKTIEGSISANQKKADIFGAVVSDDIAHTSEGKGKETPVKKNSGSHNKLVNGQVEREPGTPRFSIVHNAGGLEKRRVDTVRHVEKDAKEAVEGKEKEKPHQGSAVVMGDGSKYQSGKILAAHPEFSNGKDFGSDRLQNFGGRVRDEPSLSKSHIIDKSKWTNQKSGESIGEKISGVDKRRAEPVGTTVERNIRSGIEGKDTPIPRIDLYIKANGQVEKTKCPRVSFVHNFDGAEKSKVELVGSSEKEIKKTLDRNESSRNGAEVNANNEREKERKRKPQDEDCSLQRMEKRAKEAGDADQKFFRLKGTIEYGCTSSLSREPGKIPSPGVNSKKRKEPEMNGFLHDNYTRPSKLQRPIPTSQPSIENQRKLEQSMVSPLPAPREQGARINCELKKEVLNVNGALEASKSASSSAIPSAPSRTEKIHNKVAVRPPHPDAKYLSEIFSVPKMEDWPEFDDQEWLYSSQNCLPKKPEDSAASGVTKAREQVWDKAFQLKSADISVLPYVIPY